MSVPATPSASLIVLRDRDHGLEVLVARRNPKLRMAGNFWVFPGGALDESDRQLAEQLNRADVLLPYRLNAVRETREEVALSIEPGAIHFCAHWVAPDQMAMRFDTRFFVAAMPADQTPQPDGNELVELRWLTPGELVTGSEQGDYQLMFPTLMNARRLIQFQTAQQAIDDAQRQSISPIKPGLSFRNGKGVAHVPAEVGFGITEWEFTYPIKTVPLDIDESDH